MQRADHPMMESLQRDGSMHSVPPTSSPRDVTLLELATCILQYRHRIFIWMLACGTLALGLALLRRPQFTAVASFTPQSSDSQRSGLSSLAGQLGISVPGSAASQSQFYAELLKSHALLAPIAGDTVTVPELGPGPRSFMAVLQIDSGSAARMSERFVEVVSRASDSRVNLSTGTVTLSVRSPWRSVSLALADRMLKRVNDFNVRTRQSQAAEERRFVEGRLALARQELRAAEDRLEAFLRGNRQVGSPDLVFARDRLQREVTVQQGVVSTLVQSYEDVRIREVRDTPVITIVEPPTASTLPDPRRRALTVLAGLLAGVLIGIVIALSRDVLARRRAAGDPQTDEFLRQLRAMWSGLKRPFRRAAASQP
jgi:uncharacterized protein involved in exopolysaccharide biosynthesis